MKENICAYILDDREKHIANFYPEVDVSVYFGVGFSDFDSCKYFRHLFRHLEVVEGQYRVSE